MGDYLEQFDQDDRERIFRFFALFSRSECALKKSTFLKSGRFGQAEADWTGYADGIESIVGGLVDEGFGNARDYLLAHPPEQQVKVGNMVKWRPNPRRQAETDTRYLLRVVRDVRNNLFHGGKYVGGPVDEIARDRKLIDAATTVLQVCIELRVDVKDAFEEAA